MDKAKLQGMYDMFGFTPEKENIFEEQRLRKAMNEHAGRVKRNKDIFSEREPQFFKCKMYKPCPICDKCEVKASHLFERCAECTIPLCNHKHKDKVFMIRRENFRLNLDNQIIQELRKLSTIAEEIKNGRLGKSNR